MSEDLLYLIFMFILLLAFGAYFFIKDKENSMNLLKLQKAMEELERQNHFLRKELLSQKEEQSSKPSFDTLQGEIKALLDAEISHKILPILKSLKGFESVIEDFQTEQENRLSNLEQKAQSISKLTPDYANEEQKIVEMFQQGKSIEQIAKDLRIGIGNVELVLKFKQLME